jgi:hypothetical protein
MQLKKLVAQGEQVYLMSIFQIDEPRPEESKLGGSPEFRAKLAKLLKRYEKKRSRATWSLFLHCRMHATWIMQSRLFLARRRTKTTYQMNPTELDELKRQVEELMARGLIRPSTSPYDSPVISRKKCLTASMRGLSSPEYYYVKESLSITSCV